jgi:hypothetical protein
VRPVVLDWSEQPQLADLEGVARPLADPPRDLLEALVAP